MCSVETSRCEFSTLGLRIWRPGYLKKVNGCEKVGSQASVVRKEVLSGENQVEALFEGSKDCITVPQFAFESRVRLW